MKDTNTGEAANCRPKNDICLQIPPTGARIQNVVPSWAELPPPLRSHPSKLFVETTTRFNLSKTTVHDIWNDPDFIAFREEVLRYAFPYCSNCNVAPCDFILGPEFKNDCSAATVPCGDCFWCMGMFNCLQ